MPVEHSPKGLPARLPDVQAGGLVPPEDPVMPRPTAVGATDEKEPPPPKDGACYTKAEIASLPPSERGSSEEIPFVDKSLTTAFWKMFVNELQGQPGGAASSGNHGPLPAVLSDEKPPAPKKPLMVLQLHYETDLTKMMRQKMSYTYYDNNLDN
ncbi:hypothetical protein PCASD_26371 [Puccinia coronata f. sp. avenae]|uniref:Uncharacterized protein n=1 Tax=Puccinia coronata f. sp. avenae TaxID=200324 RepID=A0A2N5TKJ0_9BASI|nr:hypothetical protein PCASD_26371 [Puccinia coronata f. sp. avenae]